VSAPTTLLLIVFAALSISCASTPRASDSPPHHTEEGFRNNYPHPAKPSFWLWQWRRLTEGVPENPDGGYQFPVLTPDVAYLAANRSRPTLTWIGHATFLLQLEGINILTDPHFTERASPVSFAGPRRHVPPPMTIAQLPRIDLVVISHNHYDHLDLETVKSLNRQAGGAPLFLVPLGMKTWFNEQGIANVLERDWWQTHTYQDLNVYFTPVQHWSKRTLWDTNKSLWGSWVFEHARMRVFFGGDFGYSKDQADVGERFGDIDLALLPIGAYDPRWFMAIMHVNPEEAVRTFRDLRARQAVGMHWGTFRLTDELLDEPPKVLKDVLARAGIPEQDFLVMKHGETRTLDHLLRNTVKP